MKKYLLLPMLFGLFMLIAQPALAFCSTCGQISGCTCSPCVTGCAIPVQPAPQLVYQPKIISQPGLTYCPKLSYCPKTVMQPVITYQSRTVLEPVTTFETRTFYNNRVVYEPHLVCPPACPTHIMGAAAPIRYAQPVCCPERRSFWDRVF